MDPITYTVEAQRTKSNLFRNDLVGHHHLWSLLLEARQLGQKLNAVKKALYYGKGIKVDPEQDVPLTAPAELGEPLHMAIGLTTEAIEILEIFFSAIYGDKPVDQVHVREECGDVLWYLSHQIRLAGGTFFDVMSRNIEKLRTRFPEKFASDKALNRDLVSERAVLEA